MKATIDKTFQVSQPIDKVWAYLSNPEKVVTCVPGANLTEKIDEDNYKGMVSLKLGPVSAKYDGEIKIENLDPANYLMVISGKGKDTKGKGSAGMTMNGQLSALDAANTEVGYNMEVSVTGKLAQFGSRLIVDVSDQLADQFIDSFKSALETEPVLQGPAGGTVTEATGAQADNSVNALALMWQMIKNFFARLFGGKKEE
jgi:carbon monoxide dehydrogenase subunit G